MTKLKKPLSFFLFFLSTVTLTFYSCKKERQLQKNTNNYQQPQALEDGDLELGERIESFYATMQDLEPGSASSQDSIDVDSAEFLIEATYNYYCARINYEAELEHVQFELTKPLQGANQLNMKDAADAFWQIKQELIAVYNNIDYDDKTLSLFDLEVEVVDDHVRFVIEADITKSIGFTESTTTDANGDKVINQSSDHVWGTIDHSNMSNIDAQGTISTSPSVNVSPSSGQNPGALATLKKYGIFNYLIKYNQSTTPIVLNVNIQNGWTIDPWSGGSQIPTASSSQYLTMGLTGYNPSGFGLNAYNGSMWIAWQNYGSTGASLTDPEILYKEWLTTPMMNFYLKYLPDILQAGLGGFQNSKTPADYSYRILNFDISGSSSGSVLSPTNSSSYLSTTPSQRNPFSYYAKRVSYTYYLKFCKITQKLLPNGQPLPNL
jgi:hypothetical protein